MVNEVPSVFYSAPTHGGVVNVPMGDVNYYYDRHPYHLVARSIQKAGADPDWLRQPSRLLDAEHRVVAFWGRDDERQRLRKWRDSRGHLSAYLLHAPGGQGKTRLAAQFAAESAGWQTIHAHPGIDPAPDHERIATDSLGDRSLIVVDYADRWPADALMTLCTEVSRTAGTVRFLMIGRSPHFWWPLLGRVEPLGIVGDDSPLAPLADEHDREQLFLAAGREFAIRLGMPEPDRCEVDLRTPGFESVLAVHMYALATVLSGTENTPAPSEVDQVAAYLLKREMAAWRTLRRAGAQGDIDYQSGDRVLAQAVFLSILAGPMPGYGDAMAVLEKVRMGDDATVAQILADHRHCYPARGGTRYLEPLYPDRLAEDFLALLTPGHAVRGFPSDGWAEWAAPRLLARGSDGSAPPYTRQALIYLSAATARWPHMAPGLNELLREDPELAAVGGNVVLENITEITEIEPEVLELVEEHLPAERRLDLEVGVWKVTERTTGRKLREATRPEVIATLRIRRGMRRLSAGLPGPALTDIDHAVDILRRLARLRPTVGWLALAQAASLQGTALVESNRLRDAVGSYVLAESVLRKEAHDGRISYMLLEVMVNKARILAELGDLEDAKTVAEEASRLLGTRTWTNTQDLAARVGLASSLAAIHQRRGDPVSASAVLRETVAYCRSRPDISIGHLFGTLLLNLGATAYEAGLHEESQAATDEAEALLADVAAANPAAYSDLHQMAAANRKDINEMRAQTASRADQSKKALGIDAINRYTLAASRGDSVKAREHLQEGITRLRDYGAETPGQPVPELAVALNHLGAEYLRLKDAQRALETLNEAEKMYLDLEVSFPGLYPAHLAHVHLNKANALAGTVGIDEAMKMARLAAKEAEPLLASIPLARDVLYYTLLLQAQLQEVSGRQQLAVAARDKAAELRGTWGLGETTTLL